MLRRIQRLWRQWRHSELSLSGLEVCTLPGPAGELQHAMMSDQPFQTQLQPYKALTSTIQQPSPIMNNGGEVFNSLRWQAAVTAAGLA